jgi:hypothetical protein
MHAVGNAGATRDGEIGIMQSVLLRHQWYTAINKFKRYPAVQLSTAAERRKSNNIRFHLKYNEWVLDSLVCWVFYATLAWSNFIKQDM